MATFRAIPKDKLSTMALSSQPDPSKGSFGIHPEFANEYSLFSTKADYGKRFMVYIPDIYREVNGKKVLDVDSPYLHKYYEDFALPSYNEAVSGVESSARHMSHNIRCSSGLTFGTANDDPTQQALVAENPDFLMDGSCYACQLKDSSSTLVTQILEDFSAQSGRDYTKKVEDEHIRTVRRKMWGSAPMGFPTKTHFIPLVLIEVNEVFQPVTDESNKLKYKIQWYRVTDTALAERFASFTQSSAFFTAVSQGTNWADSPYIGGNVFNLTVGTVGKSNVDNSDIMQAGLKMSFIFNPDMTKAFNEDASWQAYKNLFDETARTKWSSENAREVIVDCQVVPNAPMRDGLAQVATVVNNQLALRSGTPSAQAGIGTATNDSFGALTGSPAPVPAQAQPAPAQPAQPAPAVQAPAPTQAQAPAPAPAQPAPAVQAPAVAPAGADTFAGNTAPAIDSVVSAPAQPSPSAPAPAFSGFTVGGANGAV